MRPPEKREILVRFQGGPLCPDAEPCSWTKTAINPEQGRETETQYWGESAEPFVVGNSTYPEPVT